MDATVNAAGVFRNVKHCLGTLDDRESISKIQTAIQHWPHVVCEADSDLANCILQACHAHAFRNPSSAPVKPKLLVVNVLWKLLLLVLGDVTLSEQLYIDGMEFILRQTHNAVLYSNWEDIRDVKLGAFMTSHLASAIRAQPRRFLSVSQKQSSNGYASSDDSDEDSDDSSTVNNSKHNSQDDKDKGGLMTRLTRIYTDACAIVASATTRGSAYTGSSADPACATPVLAYRNSPNADNTTSQARASSSSPIARTLPGSTRVLYDTVIPRLDSVMYSLGSACGEQHAICSRNSNKDTGLSAVGAASTESLDTCDVRSLLMSTLSSCLRASSRRCRRRARHKGCSDARRSACATYSRVRSRSGLSTRGNEVDCDGNSSRSSRSSSNDARNRYDERAENETVCVRQAAMATGLFSCVMNIYQGYLAQIDSTTAVAMTAKSTALRASVLKELTRMAQLWLCWLPAASSLFIGPRESDDTRTPGSHKSTSNVVKTAAAADIDARIGKAGAVTAASIDILHKTARTTVGVGVETEPTKSSAMAQEEEEWYEVCVKRVVIQVAVELPVSALQDRNGCCAGDDGTCQNGVRARRSSVQTSAADEVSMRTRWVSYMSRMLHLIASHHTILYDDEAFAERQGSDCIDRKEYSVDDFNTFGGVDSKNNPGEAFHYRTTDAVGRRTMVTRNRKDNADDFTRSDKSRWVCGCRARSSSMAVRVHSSCALFDALVALAAPSTLSVALLLEAWRQLSYRLHEGAGETAGVADAHTLSPASKQISQDCNSNSGSDGSGSRADYCFYETNQGKDTRAVSHYCRDRFADAEAVRQFVLDVCVPLGTAAYIRAVTEVDTTSKNRNSNTTITTTNSYDAVNNNTNDGAHISSSNDSIPDHDVARGGGNERRWRRYRWAWLGALACVTSYLCPRSHTAAINIGSKLSTATTHFMTLVHTCHVLAPGLAQGDTAAATAAITTAKQKQSMPNTRVSRQDARTSVSTWCDENHAASFADDSAYMNTLAHRLAHVDSVSSVSFGGMDWWHTLCQLLECMEVSFSASSSLSTSSSLSSPSSNRQLRACTRALTQLTRTLQQQQQQHERTCSDAVLWTTRVIAATLVRCAAILPLYGDSTSLDVCHSMHPCTTNKIDSNKHKDVDEKDICSKDHRVMMACVRRWIDLSTGDALPSEGDDTLSGQKDALLDYYTTRCLLHLIQHNSHLPVPSLHLSPTVTCWLMQLLSNSSTRSTIDSKDNDKCRYNQANDSWQEDVTMSSTKTLQSGATHSALANAAQHTARQTTWWEAYLHRHHDRVRCWLTDLTCERRRRGSGQGEVVMGHEPSKKYGTNAQSHQTASAASENVVCGTEEGTKERGEVTEEDEGVVVVLGGNGQACNVSNNTHCTADSLLATRATIDEAAKTERANDKKSKTANATGEGCDDDMAEIAPLLRELGECEQTLQRVLSCYSGIGNTDGRDHNSNSYNRCMGDVRARVRRVQDVSQQVMEALSLLRP